VAVGPVLSTILGIVCALLTSGEPFSAEREARGRLAPDGACIKYKLHQDQELIGELLARLNVPRFGANPTARIDRRTLLPVVDGRRFSELNPQGLQVLVNIAHALAHHLTAIDLGISLPGLLVIDGPTSNIGHEGSDLALIHSIHRLLVEVSTEYGDRLQLVVADNDVPETARSYVRQELSPSNRLIPVRRA
jgi:hypothetical protein